MKYLILLLIMLPVVASAQSKKDTLVVPAHVKVIVIDGVAYDVVRSTELKKSEPASIWGGFRGSGSITVDTTGYWRRNSIFLGLPSEQYFLPRETYKSIQ